MNTHGAALSSLGGEEQTGIHRDEKALKVVKEAWLVPGNYWSFLAGEFMQLGSKEEEDERFAHYLDKTFKKTASMLAASCKSVSDRFWVNQNQHKAFSHFCN